MAQATRLPALGGYLNTAQRNLIDKQTDHRIWRYWALENLWGNLAADPDPIARENIMFTGFCAAQIAMYHAAAGRRDYDRPASFALRHSSGRNYDYDLAALIEALDRERRKSAFHLIACEPDWIYPLCNTIDAAATKAHDRMTGGNRWSASEGGFRRHLEDEFIDLAGRFVPCRSSYSGVALPMIGGAQPQAMPCFFLTATMPEIALRHWLLLRRDLMKARSSGHALDIGCSGGPIPATIAFPAPPPSPEPRWRPSNWAMARSRGFASTPWNANVRRSTRRTRFIARMLLSGRTRSRAPLMRRVC